MSKKFKNKACAYCGTVAATMTADHVIAREFFLTDCRANLPKVPACTSCNSKKSQLEHHFASLLPFGGRHNAAQQNLSDMVPKRLSKNERLRRELREKKETVWAREGEIFQPVTGLPLDFPALMNLFLFIAKGMAYHHWQIDLDMEYSIGITALSKSGEAVYDGLISEAAENVSNNFGEGTFVYHGARLCRFAHASIWRMQIYGVKMQDPGAGSDNESTWIGATIVPGRPNWFPF